MVKPATLHKAQEELNRTNGSAWLRLESSGSKIITIRVFRGPDEDRYLGAFFVDVSSANAGVKEVVRRVEVGRDRFFHLPPRDLYQEGDPPSLKGVAEGERIL